jgi:hypothetical protein
MSSIGMVIRRAMNVYHNESALSSALRANTVSQSAAANRQQGRSACKKAEVYAGVPHARDCVVCDECLQTELPRVRIDYSTWDALDPAKEQLVMLRNRAASSGNGNVPSRTLRAKAPDSPFHVSTEDQPLDKPAWLWEEQHTAAAAMFSTVKAQGAFGLNDRALMGDDQVKAILGDHANGMSMSWLRQ